jgi:AcrR family transcriptional regulator
MILAAAEKIFIQKGYSATRTTDIADAAGVNHALLHYYFRTKEALFERIFERKISKMLDSVWILVESDLPFFEKIKSGIERHFDFIAEDPALPFFVLREIIQNEDRKNLVRTKITPVVLEIIEKISASVQAEIDKGTIRPIQPQHLLLNIASLNVFSFMALQILFDMENDCEADAVRQFLAERKKSNVETIINSIKTDPQSFKK